MTLKYLLVLERNFLLILADILQMWYGLKTSAPNIIGRWGVGGLCKCELVALTYVAHQNSGGKAKQCKIQFSYLSII